MSSTFHNVNVFLRTVVLLAIVLVVGWWTLFLKNRLAGNERALSERSQQLDEARADLERRQREIEDLGGKLQERAAEIVRLQASLEEAQRRADTLEFANRLLKVEHRVARMEIVAMGAPADDPEHVRTTVLFTELDGSGAPLAPGRELTVEGKTVYVESLVIQFEDRYVEQGDALRGTSLCLFRRLFGENQSPSQGVPIDPVGEQPSVYRDDELPDSVHRALWQRFWDYANDPALARELGVRALQGEAPFIQARLGARYRLQLRASGGLVIQAE